MRIAYLSFSFVLLMIWNGCGEPNQVLNNSFESGAGILTKLAAVTRPGTLIGSTNDNPAVSGTLVSLDPATGAGTTIAVLPGPTVSLEFSHHDGRLYGAMLVFPGGSPPADFHLITIDPLTGAVNSVGVFRNAADPTVKYRVAAMGFDESGALYAIHSAPATQDDLLLRVDPATAEATVIGPLGRILRNMGATLEDGVFYLMARVPVDEGDEITLFTVDLTTGSATEIGGTGLFDNGVGITTGGDGRLLAVVDDTLYDIDRTSGTASEIGPTGFTVLSGLGFVDEIDRLSPCGGPPGGGAWKNHGEYVSYVAEVLEDLHEAGVITGQEKGQLQAQAAQSDCGKP